MREYGVPLMLDGDLKPDMGSLKFRELLGLANDQGRN